LVVSLNIDLLTIGQRWKSKSCISVGPDSETAFVLAVNSHHRSYANWIV